LLIADEPVSSLDVSLQAQIVELLIGLQRRLGLAMLFITHDLALAGQISDRIAVMYRGRIVEQGRPEEVLLRPLHPYTKALLDSVPKGFRQRREVTRTAVGFSPEGDVSAMGCPYAPRCGQAMSICSRVVPPAVVMSEMHLVRCHLPVPELATPCV
jgi:oligopeptide/dipeptide ABC transporter ATP-binding protein